MKNTVRILALVAVMALAGCGKDNGGVRPSLKGRNMSPRSTQSTPTATPVPARPSLHF